MVLPADKVLQAVYIVLHNKEGKNTASSSFSAAGYTALGTVVGGLLGGRVGALAGAAVGGLGALMKQKDTFKPIHQVLKQDLSNRDRKELVRALQPMISEWRIGDVATLLTFAKDNTSFNEAIFNFVANFVQNRLNSTC